MRVRCAAAASGALSHRLAPRYMQGSHGPRVSGEKQASSAQASLSLYAMVLARRPSKRKTLHSPRPPLPPVCAPEYHLLFAIKEQLLRRNVKRFRGGLVCKAHRRLYHSNLGSRVRQEKEEDTEPLRASEERRVGSFAVMRGSSKEGSCLRLVDFCIT
jgi:hypothetical protein